MNCVSHRYLLDMCFLTFQYSLMLGSDGMFGSQCCGECLDFVLNVRVIFVLTKEVSRVTQGLVILTGPVVRDLKSFFNPDNFTMN